MANQYLRDESIEVCSKEEGFVGSYYAATVVSHLRNDLYVVRYERLFEDDDSTQQLVETIRNSEIRPPPPPAETAEFALHDSVDAFDNDGWWVGRISARTGPESYSVFFESSGAEISYPISRLRPHLDWVRGKWVSPAKKNKKQ